MTDGRTDRHLRRHSSRCTAVRGKKINGNQFACSIDSNCDSPSSSSWLQSSSLLETRMRESSALEQADLIGASLLDRACTVSGIDPLFTSCHHSSSVCQSRVPAWPSVYVRRVFPLVAERKIVTLFRQQMPIIARRRPTTNVGRTSRTSRHYSCITAGKHYASFIAPSVTGICDEHLLHISREMF